MKFQKKKKSVGWDSSGNINSECGVDEKMKKIENRKKREKERKSKEERKNLAELIW